MLKYPDYEPFLKCFSHCWKWDCEWKRRLDVWMTHFP